MLYLLAFVAFFLLLNFSADLISDALLGELSSGEDIRHEAKEFGLIVLFNMLMLPLVVLTAIFVAHRMLAPIRTITHTAHAISGGRIKERIPGGERNDELGALASVLNRAFDRYEDVLQKQQRFSSNAAHQLRTPLASLRAIGEIALQRERDEASYRQCVVDMLEQTTSLTRLIEQMLELSHLEQWERPHGMERIELAQLAGKVVDDFLPVCEASTINLQSDIVPAVSCMGNRSLLEQLMINLMDNATRHTPPHGTIRLSLFLEEGGVTVLRVEDSGPGIPAKDRDRIFQRFEQGTAAKSGGHGLGLAIVQEIARVHGGTIALAKSALGGTCITIRFSLALDRVLQEPVNLNIQK